MYHSLREICLISQMSKSLERCNINDDKSVYEALKAGGYSDKEIDAYAYDAIVSETHRRRLMGDNKYLRRRA